MIGLMVGEAAATASLSECPKTRTATSRLTDVPLEHIVILWRFSCAQVDDMAIQVEGQW